MKCVFVRNSPQSQPPLTSHNTHQITITWSLAPAVINQHSFKYTLLSVSHRPVYWSPTWTKPDSPLLCACLYLPACTYLLFSAALKQSSSTSFQNHPAQPAKETASAIIAKHQETDICVRTHLLSFPSIPLASLKINIPVLLSNLLAPTCVVTVSPLRIQLNKYYLILKL